MDLETYLRKNKMSVVEFAAKAKLATATLYRIMDGGKTWKANAEKIEKATNGEVIVEVVDRRAIAKQLKEKKKSS